MKKKYLFFLIVLILYSCAKKNNPISGNIYIIVNKNNTYTTWKITETKGDSIWYIKNDCDVSERSLIDSIEANEYYTDSPHIIVKENFYKKQNIYLYKTQLK